MKKDFVLLFLIVPVFIFSNCKKGYNDTPDNRPSTDTFTVNDCKRCIILTERDNPEVDIVDAKREGMVMWSWSPYHSDIPNKNLSWFSTGISDAKPIYDMEYIMLTASGGYNNKGGGVAIIRIADSKVIFYAYAGKNTHSVELLPDGNIVTASSSGHCLTVFHVDTSVAPEKLYKKRIPLPSAHNVVWDKKRQVLWSAGQNILYKFQYNFNCKKPDLIKKGTFSLPGKYAHDLFPVYGKDSLWLTSNGAIYTIDMRTKEVSIAYVRRQIKSISSGPDDWPTIIMEPKVKWWSDEVIDIDRNSVVQQKGKKIYKARWFLPNAFSYDKIDHFITCL